MGALVSNQERVRACLWSLLFPCVLIIAALGALYFVMPAGFGGDAPKSGNRSDAVLRVRTTPGPVVEGAPMPEAPAAAGNNTTEAPSPPETEVPAHAPANETTEDKKKKDPAAEADEAATKKPLKKRKAVVATEAPAEDAAPETAKPSKKKKTLKVTE